ncbi:hypothetical protein J2801_001863 [Paraburkholderia phenoliruptrix]|nr:hypothetical protein [Paraburkholderia phenoliruptrix]
MAESFGECGYLIEKVRWRTKHFNPH